MPKKIDLTGQPFGRLVVICEAGRKNGHVAWLCRCDCGKEVVVSGDSLRTEHTRSCGCLNRKRLSEWNSERNTTHGCSYEPWYPAYATMMQRCGHWEGGDEHNLHNYRDRGITVCEEWRESPQAFGDWLLAHGWRKGLEIDRIDNSKGYSPDNCHVVTHRENINNRRNTLRLDDGTSLAMFCSSLGIETRKDGKMTKQYQHIQHAWRSHHRIHSGLMQSLVVATKKEERLLEETKLRCKRAELMIKGLREFIASR